MLPGGSRDRAPASTDSQVNTGRADAEAVRQSHGGAKRRRGGRAKLDTDFGEATLAALRTRAKRLGLAPSTWVRAVVRDALHASRSEELDAAVAAHLLGVEARAQVSADARELAAQIRPLAINVALHERGCSRLSASVAG